MSLAKCLASREVKKMAKVRTYDEMVKNLAFEIRCCQEYDQAWGYARAIAAMFGKSPSDVYDEAFEYTKTHFKKK